MTEVDAAANAKAISVVDGSFIMGNELGVNVGVEGRSADTGYELEMCALILIAAYYLLFIAGEMFRNI